MKNLIKYNGIAMTIIFALLGLGSLIGVFTGANHHLVVSGFSFLMAYVCYSDVKAGSSPK